VLCPLLIPLATLDRNIFKIAGQTHWRASFLGETWTKGIGQFWSADGRASSYPVVFASGGKWRELAKGRIDVDYTAGNRECEVYTGGPKGDLEEALRS